MPNVWSRVAAFTHKYPLSRGMLSYACIWPLGSCVQQKIQGKETLDFWRAVRFSLYGCCFVAPTLYTWMTVAGYMFPKPGLRSGIYKVSYRCAYQDFSENCLSFKVRFSFKLSKERSQYLKLFVLLVSKNGGLWDNSYLILQKRIQIC